MTFDDPAAQRAARRSGALAGLGLLWFALLASLGLLWIALGAVVATVVGVVALLVATWRPHLAVRMRGDGARRAAGRAATATAEAGRITATRTGAAARASSAWLRRAAGTTGVHTSAAARRAAAAAGSGTKAVSSASRTAADGARRRAATRRPLPRRASLVPKLHAVRSTVAARAGALELPTLAGATVARPPRARSRRAGHKLAHESVVARRDGRVGEAISLAHEAVDAFRATEDRRGEALALNTLALALAQDRRYAEAVQALDGALTLLGELGDRHREGTVLVNLGTLHRQAGGLESARFCWRKALERLDPASPESQETERLLRAS